VRARDWVERKLGDLLHVKHGFAFLGEYFGSVGTHIVLTPGNFLDQGGFKEIIEKRKWYRGPIPKDYVLSEGDVLVAMTEQAEGLLGSSAVIPRSGMYLHNQRLGLIQIRDHQKADKRFLYYLFNSKAVRQQIRASASGTKIRHTAPSRIEDVRVYIPPLLSQRRIASILSAYDELIENSQRRIRILETMARSLYREWFVNLRFPGHEKVRRLPSALGDIPEGWEVLLVKDILARRSSGTVYRESDVKPHGATPVFDQSTNEVLGFHENPPDHSASPEKPIAIFGDHTCKMRLFIEPFSVGPNVVPFVADRELPTAYVFYAVNSLVQTQEYKRHWMPLNAKEIIVGDRATTHLFESHIQPMLVGLETLTKVIRNLRRTRDLLLPRLLSGQIDVELAE
jgi:type I restriction enzyme, S subunit